MATERPLVTGRKKTKLDHVTDICRATLRAAKLGESRTQGLINSTGFKAEFRELIERHAVPVFRPNKWQQRAIGILGKENIVCPQEITNIRGLTYPAQLLEAFDEAVTDRKALRWCSEHGYAIVQDALISGDEFCPNGAELAWFITTMLEVRGIRLFTQLWARTRSVTANGYRVFLSLDSSGVGVSDWLGDAHPLIGIAATRRFRKH